MSQPMPPYPYGAPGQQTPPPYGAPQQPQYGAPSPYGAPPSPYGAPSPYAAPPSPYGTPPPQAPYGAPSPYGTPPPQAPYAAPPQAQVPPMPAAAAGTQQIPPEVYQQAAMYQLGDPLEQYRPALTNPLLIIGGALGLIALDILLLIAVYNIGFIVYVFLILPIVAIVYAARALPICNMRIHIFTNGFIRANGSKIDVVRWEQIEAIWQRSVRSRYGSTSHTYTVMRGDGLKMKFNSLIKRVGDLGSALQDQVSRLQTPRAIAAYNSGNTVMFGKISVSMQGISNGSKTLPWNEVSAVTLKRGYVTVQRQGGWSMNWASVSDTPNYHVLLNLVNHARQGRR